MSGEATVGSILGYLRLDRSDWDSELRAAGAKADELGRHNPNIKIGTNAPSAIAQLAAVAAAVKRLQDAQGAEGLALSKLSSLREKGVTDAGRLKAAEENVAKARRNVANATIQLAAAQDRNDQAVRKAAADTDNLAKKADQATNSFKVGLIPALLAIAPAAVPIAGVATGALIGLIPVAATVELAVKGIEKQMKSAAGAGGQFGQSVATLKGDLGTLQNTAASGLMVGINKALAGSQPLFKTVNSDIAVMSNQLGDIVAGAAPALLQILTALNPLFVTFGNLLATGAGKLEHWSTSSGGVQRFVAYVEGELPTVMSLIEHLAVLFGHVVQAAAPIGNTVLHVLNAVTSAIDAIPVPVLTDLGYAFVALYPVVKLAGIFNAISAAMGRVGVTSAAAKLGLSGLAVGALAAGYGLDQLGHKISSGIEAGNAFAKTTDNIGKDTQNWTTALLANNGVVDQNTRLQVALALQQNGVASSAAKAGVSLGQLVNAVTGGKNAAIAMMTTLKDSGKVSGDTIIALDQMAGGYLTSAKTAKAAAAASKMVTETAKTQTAATQVVADTTAQYATELTKVNTALQTYYDTILGNAATEDQFLLGLKQLTGQVKGQSKSLSENSVAGLQNRNTLISLLQSAENAAKGSKNYTAALEGNVKQFEQSAINAGFSKSAVEKLIAQMHLTPKDIETKFNADTTPAMRALQVLNNYIKTHTWDVTVRVNASGQTMGYIPGVGYTQVAPKKKATGGEIDGPGPKGVDSVPLIGAPGEFMMRAAAVDKYGLGFMRSLNNGTFKAPTMQVPSESGSARGGGATVVQHIYPQPGQSPREIGRAAGDEIAWALR